MPKISFIIPAYKGRFFREAVRSILAQTYRDCGAGEVVHGLHGLHGLRKLRGG